jgi:hypothetical protein
MAAAGMAININGLGAGMNVITIPNVFGKGESFQEKVVIEK